MRLLIAFLFFVLTPAAVAHTPLPVHGCVSPERPPDDVGEIVWKRFLDDVERYRACISDFVRGNYAASDAHRDAANAATLDWNAFVRDTLNVPEDFPWQPEDSGDQADPDKP
ncbi:MAG: hypothetical protein GWM88_01950 [Pseudomonadales bacterium]|nr:hypothetical protein [Pseudomonadales bacterium]NIX06842.1 hypothetical protein [Pseudomonadales bacterium]